MTLHHGTRIVTDSLSLYLDVLNPKSYPGSGTTWFDLSNGVKIPHTLYGGAVTATIGNATGFNFTTGTLYARKTSTTITLTTDHTYTGWAYPLSDAEVSTWRTLWRTSANHPILIQKTTNLIGYYASGAFRSFGLSASTLGLENKWSMWTVVTASAVSRLYINDWDTGATVAYGSAGNTHDFVSYSGQPWGYVATTNLYSKALSHAEIIQNFNSMRGRFGV